MAGDTLITLIGNLTAAEAVGVKVYEGVLHTAMGDARLAAAIWDRVMGGAA
jgi:hypothetical protein